MKASRFDYVKYDNEASSQQEVAKIKASELEGVIATLNVSRSSALAFTKLEECYMWIGKAIRDDQIKRNGSAELLEERKNG